MATPPNFRDPRNRRRALQAIEQLERYLKPHQVYSISQSQRRAWFGTLSNPVSQWLDSRLLEPVDPYFNMNTGQCIKYRLRDQNLQQLKSELGIAITYTATAEIQQQIDTGDFDYEIKSDRWYTAAQFIPSEVRGRLLANSGYRYRYDIEAAAPTILLQRAQQICADFSAPALSNFIANRTAVRQQIAQEAQATVLQVKTVINAILQGSVITSWSNNKLFCALNYDYPLVERLKLSATLNALRDDIRCLWQCLRDEFPRQYSTDRNGTRRCRRLSAREKSAYYRRYENEVARVIQRYLKKTRTRYLWVHDGWQCDNMLDPNIIQSQVKRQTGFVIRLDWEIYQD
jgi:hypothetical protein